MFSHLLVAADRAGHHRPASNWIARLAAAHHAGQLEFFEPLGLIGLHAAALGQPAMPRRLSDHQVSAHLVEGLTAGEELLPSASLRMICSGVCRWRLFGAMSSSILPAQILGQKSPTTNWTTTTSSPQSKGSPTNVPSACACDRHASVELHQV
jgi:hypothetical protein